MLLLEDRFEGGQRIVGVGQGATARDVAKALAGVPGDAGLLAAFAQGLGPFQRPFLFEGDQDDEGEAAKRELFRDLRFRKALSYATDRDGIA